MSLTNIIADSSANELLDNIAEFISGKTPKQIVSGNFFGKKSVIAYEKIKEYRLEKMLLSFAGINSFEDIVSSKDLKKGLLGYQSLVGISGLIKGTKLNSTQTGIFFREKVKELNLPSISNKTQKLIDSLTTEYILNHSFEDLKEELMFGYGNYSFDENSLFYNAKYVKISNKIKYDLNLQKALLEKAGINSLEDINVRKTKTALGCTSLIGLTSLITGQKIPYSKTRTFLKQTIIKINLASNEFNDFCKTNNINLNDIEGTALTSYAKKQIKLYLGVDLINTKTSYRYGKVN